MLILFFICHVSKNSILLMANIFEKVIEKVILETYSFGWVSISKRCYSLLNDMHVNWLLHLGRTFPRKIKPIKLFMWNSETIFFSHFRLSWYWFFLFVQQKKKNISRTDSETIKIRPYLLLISSFACNKYKYRKWFVPILFVSNQKKKQTIKHDPMDYRMRFNLWHKRTKQQQYCELSMSFVYFENIK